MSYPIGYFNGSPLTHLVCQPERSEGSAVRLLATRHSPLSFGRDLLFPLYLTFQPSNLLTFQRAGGRALIPKSPLGAPSLRVLQGWVFLLSLFPISNFASLPEDVFDLVKDRRVAVGRLVVDSDGVAELFH
jgi:hypothetical protein